MNIKAAAIDTQKLMYPRLTLADNERCGNVDDPTSIRHADYMLDQIKLGDIEEEKAHRWLGWAQCIVCQHGLATLEELKEINHAA